MKVALAWMLAILAWCYLVFYHKKIQRHGHALSADEVALALKMGVSSPHLIRILHIEKIPIPFFTTFHLLSRHSNISIANPIGMTLGHSIFIQRDFSSCKKLLAHELAHTMQYERAGSPFSFLWLYLYECLAHGYAHSPLEQEACELSEAP